MDVVTLDAAKAYTDEKISSGGGSEGGYNLTE